MPQATWWSATDDGISVVVRVTPGARTSEVIGVSGDRIRVRVAAPAHEGKANLELTKLLARCFGVRRSAVSVARGERSREKTVRITGVSEPPPDLGGAG